MATTRGGIKVCRRLHCSATHIPAPRAQIKQRRDCPPPTHAPLARCPKPSPQAAGQMHPAAFGLTWQMRLLMERKRCCSICGGWSHAETNATSSARRGMSRLLSRTCAMVNSCGRGAHGASAARALFGGLGQRTLNLCRCTAARSPSPSLAVLYSSMLSYWPPGLVHPPAP